MSCRTVNLIEVSQHLQTLHKSSESPRKRKQGQEVEHSFQDQDWPPSKRLRALSPSCTSKGRATIDISTHTIDPIKCWICTKRWPKDYFEQDSQVGEELEQDSWLEEQMENSTLVVQYVEIHGNRYPRPIRRAPTSLRRKQSDSSLNSSSDQKNRGSKSARYQNTSYALLLERKGGYMKESKLGISEASLTRCKTLLDSEQIVPKDSMFRDDLFRATCEKVQDRNEARVIRSITPYITPSAEDLEISGAIHLEHLIEGVNESWTGN